MRKDNLIQTELPEIGFLRINQVLRVYPVSRATWYNGIRDGIYPRPVKLADRISAWRVQDVRALIAERQK